MPARVCSISVDLDPLGCYYGIHGLGPAPAPLLDVVLRRGLVRFLEVLERRNLKATFFVVGEDLVPGSRSGTPAGRALVRQAAEAGHEIASHSYSHPYELVRLPRERIEEEIDRAHAAIAETTGAPPVGFRAPGYNISRPVFEALAARGYRYDSSILPAPVYYAAKASVMAAMSLVGRKSASVLGDPRYLFAPIAPYRPSARRPWKTTRASAGDALVELPITVTQSLRVPVIGTSVLAAPARIRYPLLDSARALPFFNFELHGLDLVGAEEDGLPAEIARQEPATRVPLRERQRAFEATLDRLALDFQFKTIAEVADSIRAGN